jgi:hypothetical protein
MEPKQHVLQEDKEHAELQERLQHLDAITDVR